MTPTITQGAGLWDGRLLEFDVLPSTNSWALDHLPELRHGDLIQAHHQSAGRGRFDRQWHSPPGTCLTLSVILDSPCPGDPLTVAMTRMAACAVRLTLENCGVPGMLKWPNDILVHGRKIAGILAERDADARKVVLGIGLNVNLPAQAIANPGLLQPVTSMSIELGLQADSCRVRKDLRGSLESCLTMDIQKLQQEWASHDALTGKDICIDTLTNSHRGKYAGMDENGRLLLQVPGRRRLCFDSGDVTVGMPKE